MTEAEGESRNKERRGLWYRAEKKKEMTSSPVERKDNSECLEMLRWTEAISSSDTAPARLPAPSHSLTDFLLWVYLCSYIIPLCVPVFVFVELCVIVCAYICALLWRQYTISALAYKITARDLCSEHVNTQTNPWIPDHFHTHMMG